jgi:Big-like domain-containing protein
VSDPRFPHDPDLEFLKDRELLELATLLRDRRAPEPPLDPAFRSSLRRDLRRRHYELLEPSTPWWRRLTSGPGLAWSGATAGAVAIAVALVFALHPLPPSTSTFVSSPLDHMRNVAVVQPMKLTFQTAMDHQSVESSLQIQPATQVTYTWSGNTLLVQPVAGALAPNTQYKLTLTTNAKTHDGQPIQQPATITFVTGATTTPSPAPSASPSPLVAGVALSGQVQLGAASGVTPVWSPDASTIYFAGADGTLESAPAAGGAPTALGVAGIHQIAISPDGSRLAVLTPAGVVVLHADGTGAQLFPVADALAVGWQQDKAYTALAAGVFEVKQGLDRARPVTAFAVAAEGAAFSPDGSRVLVLDTAAQVHLIDLPSGHDTAWPTGVAAVPQWSADGLRVAYLGSAGLTLAAPDGTSATPIATLGQLGITDSSAAALAFSAGTVLVASPAGMTGVDTTARMPVQIGSGDFTAIASAPKSGAVAYVQDGQLWTAAVLNRGLQPQLEGQAATALKTFMDARVAGDTAGAQKLLAGDAVQQFSKSSLVFNGQPRLARWFGIFQQARPDGSVVELVRLVLADQHDVDVQQLDEALTLRAGSDGSFAVVDVLQGAPRAVDGGPEVVGIQVAGGQVTVTFDSDLKPDTVGGMTLGSAPATYAKRVATFSLSGARAGDLLTLTIPASVQDLSGRSATQTLTVQIVVPSS